MHIPPRITWPWSRQCQRWLTASLALAILLLSTARAEAQDKGLQHVPASAIGFVHVRVAALLNEDTGKALLARMADDPVLGPSIQESQGLIGVSMQDVESITMILLASPLSEQLQIARFQEEFSPAQVNQLISQAARERAIGSIMIVTAKESFDRRKLISKALQLQSQPTSPTNFIITAGSSVLFLGDRSFAIGTSPMLMRYTDTVSTEKTQPGKLQSALNSASETKHHVCIAGNLSEILTHTGLAKAMQNIMDLPTLYPLFSQPCLVTADLGKSFKFELVTLAANAKSAAMATEAAKVLMTFAEMQLKQITREQLGQRNLQAYDELLLDVRKAVAGAEIALRDEKCYINLELRSQPEKLQQFAVRLASDLQRDKLRIVSRNNLRAIMLALHNYHDTYQGLPPAGIGNQQAAGPGRPLLSWRVHLLPFLGEIELYKQFQLDLPWDHPHNKKLIDKMPKVYAPVARESKAGMTYYQVFVGPDTLFEERPNANMANLRLTEIQDGPSNTLAVVEAGQPVIWTKPEDINFNPRDPLPKLGGLFTGGFHAGFCDGSIYFIPDHIGEQTLRLLITCNDGQPIPDEVMSLIGRRVGQQPGFGNFNGRGGRRGGFGEVPPGGRIGGRGGFGAGPGGAAFPVRQPIKRD